MNTDFAKSLAAAAKQKQQDVINACWNKPAFKQLEQDLAYTGNKGQDFLQIDSTTVEALENDVISTINELGGLDGIVSLDRVIQEAGFVITYPTTGDFATILFEQ